MIPAPRPGRDRKTGGAPGRGSPARPGILAVLITLSACGKPEVTACENFIREDLIATATYRRLAVKIDDYPLPKAKLVELGGYIMTSPGGRLKASAIPEAGSGLRSVRIDYQVKDAGGAQANAIKICAFALRDGKLIGDPGSAARSARTELLLPQSLRLTRDPLFDCCLP